MSVSLKILRRILDDPTSRAKAKALLLPEHFQAQEEQFLYQVILKLGGIANAPVTFDALHEFLERKSLKRRGRTLVSGLLAELCSIGSITKSDFEYALQAVAQDAQRISYCTRLQEAANYVSIGDLDRAASILTDLRVEQHRLALSDSRMISVRTMRDLKPDDLSRRTPTGFTKIDEITGGGRPTEFWLWAAYLAEYKSTALLHISHHAFTLGKRVLFISLEMDHDEIRRRLACIHGAYLDEALVYRDVEFFSFENDSKEAYKRVIEDLDDNPLYGDMLIWQPPIGVNVDDVGRQIEIYKIQHQVELVVLDYVQLLSPTRQRQQKRDELNEILEKTKSYALDLGVWVISGYQTSTEGRKKAEEKGYYDKWALSETVGAGRIANVICWSLQTEDMLANKEVKVGLAKSRNSTVAGSKHFLACDPATGFVSKSPVREDVDIYSDEEFNVEDVVSG